MSSNLTVSSALTSSSDGLHSLCFESLLRQQFANVDLGCDVSITEEPIGGLFRCLSELHFRAFAWDAAAADFRPSRSFNVKLHPSLALLCLDDVPGQNIHEHLSVGMSLQFNNSAKTFYIRKLHLDYFSISCSMLATDLTVAELRAACPLNPRAIVSHRILAHDMRALIRSTLTSPDMFSSIFTLLPVPPLPWQSPREPARHVNGQNTTQFLTLDDVLQSIRVLADPLLPPRLCSNHLPSELHACVTNFNIIDSHLPPFVNPLANASLQRSSNHPAIAPGSKVVFTRTVSPNIRVGIAYDVHSVAQEDAGSALAFCVTIFDKCAQFEDPDRFPLTKHDNTPKIILTDFARNFSNGMSVRFSQDFFFTTPPVFSDRIYHLADVSRSGFSVRFSYAFYKPDVCLEQWTADAVRCRDVTLVTRMHIAAGYSICGPGIASGTVVRSVAPHPTRAHCCVLTLSLPLVAAGGGDGIPYRISIAPCESRVQRFSAGDTSVVLRPAHPLADNLRGYYIEGPGVDHDTRVTSVIINHAGNPTETILDISQPASGFMDDTVSFSSRGYAFTSGLDLSFMFASIGPFVYGCDPLTYRPVVLPPCLGPFASHPADNEYCNGRLIVSSTDQLVPGMPVTFKSALPAVVPRIDTSARYFVDDIARDTDASNQHRSTISIRCEDGTHLDFSGENHATLQNAIAMDEFFFSDTFIMGNRIDASVEMVIDAIDPFLIRASFAARCRIGMPVEFDTTAQLSLVHPSIVSSRTYRIQRASDDCFSVSFDGRELNFSNARSIPNVAQLFKRIGTVDMWTVSPAGMQILSEGCLVQIPSLPYRVSDVRFENFTQGKHIVVSPASLSSWNHFSVSGYTISGKGIVSGTVVESVSGAGLRLTLTLSQDVCGPGGGSGKNDVYVLSGSGCYVVSKLSMETNELMLSQSSGSSPILPTNEVLEFALVDTKSYCSPNKSRWHGGILDVCAFAHVFRKQVAYRSTQLGATTIQLAPGFSVGDPNDPAACAVLQHGFDRFSLLVQGQPDPSVEETRDLSQFHFLKICMAFPECRFSGFDYLCAFSNYLKTPRDDYEINNPCRIHLSNQESCLLAAGLASSFNSNSAPSILSIYDAIHSHRKETMRCLVRNRILLAARARFFDLSSVEPQVSMMGVDDMSNMFRVSGQGVHRSCICRRHHMKFTDLPDASHGPFVCTSFLVNCEHKVTSLCISEKCNNRLQLVDLRTDSRFQSMKPMPIAPKTGNSLHMLPETKQAACGAASLPLVRIVGLRIFNNDEFWEVESCQGIHVGMKVRFYNWYLGRSPKGDKWNPCAKFYVKEIKYCDAEKNSNRSSSFDYDCFSISIHENASKRDSEPSFLVSRQRRIAMNISRNPNMSHQQAEDEADTSLRGISYTVRNPIQEESLKPSTNQFLAIPQAFRNVPTLPVNEESRVGVSHIFRHTAGTRTIENVAMSDGDEYYVVPLPELAVVSRVRGTQPTFLSTRDGPVLKFSFPAQSQPPFLEKQFVLVKGFTGEYGTSYLNGRKFRVSSCTKDSLTIAIDRIGKLDDDHATNCRITFQGADIVLASSYSAHQLAMDLKQTHEQLQQSLAVAKRLVDAIKGKVPGVKGVFQTSFINCLGRVDVQRAFLTALNDELGPNVVATTHGLTAMCSEPTEALASFAHRFGTEFMKRPDQFEPAYDVLSASACDFLQRLATRTENARKEAEAASNKYQELRSESNLQIQLCEDYAVSSHHNANFFQDSLLCHSRRFKQRLQEISSDRLRSIVRDDDGSTRRLIDKCKLVFDDVQAKDGLMHTCVNAALFPHFRGYTQALMDTSRSGYFDNFLDPFLINFAVPLFDLLISSRDVSTNSVACLAKTSAAASAASAVAAPAPTSTPESVSRIDRQVVRSIALSRAYSDRSVLSQNDLRDNCYRVACELVHGASKFLCGLPNPNPDIVHGRISPSALSRSLSHMFPLSFEGVFFTSTGTSTGVICTSTGVISETSSGAEARFSLQQKNTFETYLPGQFHFVGYTFFEVEFNALCFAQSAVLVDDSGRGSGTEASPWVARLHMAPPITTAGIVPGMVLMASDGSGSVYGGQPTSVRVTHVDHANSIVTYSVVGGTAPIAGQVTDTCIGVNSFSVIQNIAGNRAKAVLDSHGSFRKVIDFSEVCIFEGWPIDPANAVEWFPVTEHNSLFSFKSNRLFAGRKFCCFRTSVPSYEVTKVNSSPAENNLFRIEFEIGKNPFLSSWNVLSTQWQAGYLLWSPNRANAHILDTDIDARLSSLSPVGIRSGCRWNKVFDVQQLSASLYEMITGGKAPFSPTPKNVRRWIQEEEALQENLKLHPYKQFEKAASADTQAPRYNQGTISRRVSTGNWENVDYHGIRFYVHYKLPILKCEKVANVENKWKLFYKHYDCDTVVPSTHPQTRAPMQVSFENYALAGNAHVERFSLLETGTGIDADGGHYFTIFSYDSSPFSKALYVYLHSLLLLQCSLPRRKSSENNNPSGFYFLDNSGPKSVFSFETNRLACQRRKATIKTVSGSGTEASPWVARLHMAPPSTPAGIVPGMVLMASDGSGSVYGGQPTSVRVTHVDHATSIVTYSVVGGTAPIAGQVTGLFTVPESELNQEWQVRYSHSNSKLFDRYFLRCNVDACRLDFVDSNQVVFVLKLHLLQSLQSFLNTSRPDLNLNPTQHLPSFLCEMNRLASQRRKATIEPVDGSGTEALPWVARLHMAPPSTPAGIVPGMVLMASDGSGSVYGGQPTSVRVTHVDHANSIVTYSVVGGTAPVAGQVTGLFTVPESELNQEWEVYLGDCEFSPLYCSYSNLTEAISFSAKQAVLNDYLVVEVFLMQDRPAWHPAHRISFPPHHTTPFMILPHSGHSQMSVLILLPTADAIALPRYLQSTAIIQIVNFPQNMQSERSVGEIVDDSGRGSGTEASPWVARLHMAPPSTTAGIVPGMVLMASDGSGSVYGGQPTSVRVTHVDHATSIVTYSVVGGTAPVAGQVTDIGFIVNLEVEHTVRVLEISLASPDSLFSRSIPAVLCDNVLGHGIKTVNPLDEKWLLRYRVASCELSALVLSPSHGPNLCDILELRLRKCIMKSSAGAAAFLWGQLLPDTRKVFTNSFFRRELTTNADSRRRYNLQEPELAHICHSLQFAESLWALLKAGLEGNLSMAEFRDGLRDVLDANVVAAPPLAAGIAANVAAPAARTMFSARAWLLGAHASLAGASAALFGVWARAKAAVPQATSAAAAVPGNFEFRLVARHVVRVAQAVWAFFVLREVVDGQGSKEFMVALLLCTAALIIANFFL